MKVDRILVLCACVAVVSLAGAVPAGADKPYPNVPPAAQGTDGGNPTRCAKDAQLVQQVPVRVWFDGSSAAYLAGYLQLRWFPSCQGNWARFVARHVIFNGGEWGYYGKVWVSGGVFGHTYSWKVNSNFRGSSLAFYTSMVWAPTPYCASAHVELYNTSNDMVGPYADTKCF